MSSVERCEFDGLPPVAEVEAWKAWLRAHGIDPNDVIVAPEGYLERRVHSYQLAYLGVRLLDGRRRFEMIEKVVQLEGPPMPFPVACRARGAAQREDAPVMTVETLADQLAVEPGDVRVILRQHDVYVEDDLSQRNVDDVRRVLDPGGERSRHLDPGDPYGLGSQRLPTDPG